MIRAILYERTVAVCVSMDFGKTMSRKKMKKAVSQWDRCSAWSEETSVVKHKRVLKASARVVSGTNKFDRGLSRLLHTELRWASRIQAERHDVQLHARPIST